MKDLTGLKRLFLSETKVTDIEIVRNLIDLVEIDISITDIKDIKALNSALNLKKIYLSADKFDLLFDLKIEYPLTVYTNVNIDNHKVEVLKKNMPNCRVEAVLY